MASVPPHYGSYLPHASGLMPQSPYPVISGVCLRDSAHLDPRQYQKPCPCAACATAAAYDAAAYHSSKSPYANNQSFSSASFQRQAVSQELLRREHEDFLRRLEVEKSLAAAASVNRLQNSLSDHADQHYSRLQATPHLSQDAYRYNYPWIPKQDIQPTYIQPRGPVINASSSPVDNNSDRPKSASCGNAPKEQNNLNSTSSVKSKETGSTSAELPAKPCTSASVCKPSTQTSMVARPGSKTDKKIPVANVQPMIKGLAAKPDIPKSVADKDELSHSSERRFQSPPEPAVKPETVKQVDQKVADVTSPPRDTAENYGVVDNKCDQFEFKKPYPVPLGGKLTGFPYSPSQEYAHRHLSPKSDTKSKCYPSLMFADHGDNGKLRDSKYSKCLTNINGQPVDENSAYRKFTSEDIKRNIMDTKEFSINFVKTFGTESGLKRLEQFLNQEPYTLPNGTNYKGVSAGGGTLPLKCMDNVCQFENFPGKPGLQHMKEDRPHYDGCLETLLSGKRKKSCDSEDGRALAKVKRVKIAEGHSACSLETGYCHSKIKKSSKLAMPKRLSINRDIGETVLHRAARMGHESMVLHCLRAGQVGVNKKDHAGYTALHESCSRGHLRIVRYLLQHGADPNICAGDGSRPMHDAVENDHIEVTRVLLAYGADLQITTYSGKTPVKMARSKEMETFLKGYIADLSGDTSRNIASWQFYGSSSIFDPVNDGGLDIFSDVPSDDEESSLVFETSERPHIQRFYFVKDVSKRGREYMLLSDVMERLGREKGHLLASLSEAEIISAHAKDFEEDILSSDLEHTVLESPRSTEKDGDCVKLILVTGQLLHVLGIDHLVLDL